MLQNATRLRKSAPWPLNISDEHAACTSPATRNASLQILCKCPTPTIVFGNATKPSRFAHFWQGAESLAPATQNHIWTFKSGPNPWCFKHFDLEMCFAPQRCALFRHLNFQKWSEHGVFCTFWLRNLLRATTACTFSTSQLPKVVWCWCVLTWRCASRHNRCTFSTSQLPKVVRTWCVLYILTSKCASRHNGVHFFDLLTSKSGLKLVCFVHFDLEMCFAPQQVHFFDITTSESGPNLVCFVHVDFEMCFAPQRRAIFHLSSGQLAPHQPL